jgi:hypothetical protein
MGEAENQALPREHVSQTYQSHQQPMKKPRGIRIFRFEGMEVEVGRSIKEYRDRIAQKTHEAVEKIADSHFAKLTTLLLVTTFLSARCMYA